MLIERNEVQISGTIEHKVRKMRHDVLSFYLKTRDLDHGLYDLQNIKHSKIS